MPQNNPDFLAAVLAYLQNIWPNIAAACGAFWVGFFRAMYDGNPKRKAWLEGALLGFSCGITVPVFMWVGLPDYLSGSFGGVVGWFGVEKVRGLSEKWAERRIDKL